MTDLKTTYKDDVLNTSVNTRRKYKMVYNDDDTVSFEDVTDYSQIGDSFGATDINNTNSAINDVNQTISLLDKKYIKTGLSDSQLISAGASNKFDITITYDDSDPELIKGVAPTRVIAVPYNTSGGAAGISVGAPGSNSFSAILTNINNTPLYYCVVWFAIWEG